MLLLVPNFDGTGFISTNTDSLLVALPPVLQLQERSESSNKEPRSHTYLLRAKEQAVPANLLCSVQSHSFSILQPDLCGNLNRLTGWMAVLGAFCLAQISLALRKLSRERNSVLLRLTLSAIKLPARGLICDYGMSDPWHECTAKLTRAIGISWPRVKKKHMPLKSPYTRFLGFWAKPNVHILPLWSLGTKNFEFPIAYSSRVPSFLAKKSAAHTVHANKNGSLVCQGHVQESSHITPGRSDMSNQFVLLPWQWLKTLQQSCFTPYEACSLLYSTSSARRQERPCFSFLTSLTLGSSV